MLSSIPPGEVASERLVGELEETVGAPVVATHGCGQPAAHRWVLGRLIAESGPGRMSLHLLLGQTHDLTRLELKAVQPEAAGVDAVVAPAGVTLAEVEELPGRTPSPSRSTLRADCSAPARALARLHVRSGGRRGGRRAQGRRFPRARIQYLRLRRRSSSDPRGQSELGSNRFDAELHQELELLAAGRYSFMRPTTAACAMSGSDRALLDRIEEGLDITALPLEVVQPDGPAVANVKDDIVRKPLTKVGDVGHPTIVEPVSQIAVLAVVDLVAEEDRWASSSAPRIQGLSCGDSLGPRVDDRESGPARRDRLTVDESVVSGKSALELPIRPRTSAAEFPPSEGIVPPDDRVD